MNFAPILAAFLLDNFLRLVNKCRNVCCLISGALDGNAGMYSPEIAEFFILTSKVNYNKIITYKLIKIGIT